MNRRTKCLSALALAVTASWAWTGVAQETPAPMPNGENRP